MKAKAKIGYMVIEDYDEDYSNWNGYIAYPNPQGANLAWENPIKMIEYSAYEQACRRQKIDFETLKKLERLESAVETAAVILKNCTMRTGADQEEAQYWLKKNGFEV